MKYSDLKQKNSDELKAVLSDLQVELGKTRFEMANRSLKDTSKLAKVRHDIARVKTIIREYQG